LNAAQALGIDALKLVPAAIKLIEVAMPLLLACGCGSWCDTLAGGGRPERAEGFDDAAATGLLAVAVLLLQ
jgi:hypothetical protein